mmetsp:Transcript_14991/g.45250  ORF Transcript_14991/g.45250 Transcript_14991/m.45250 type:complete len:289 (+) Transcript_14991:163-1029(+)|eukprot:CAMPEP_0206150694 /NCGR_PEP_ID=MMETSP1473-20131121/38430_1 /ASSEMBLY_ACC=CAM_ASM_001109 /TAXON_ID=1461547 /ORGANISM="Stichococcus sp, Strain RCC1054" /LENGTH=288 /DNA_ID=CAMNT_0053548205 /DNA_START=125 /DNA_END=991 /DNA_ORIENTATION=+
MLAQSMVAPVGSRSVLAAPCSRHSIFRPQAGRFGSATSSSKGSQLRRVQLVPAHKRTRRAMAAQASAATTFEEGGQTFPVVRTYWDGSGCRALAAGTRTKKIAFVNVKVYAIAVYAEGDLAARELAVRKRGGFFDVDADYAQAIVDGAFIKSLVIKMCRKVDGETFVEAIAEALEPRMRLCGEMDALNKFKDFFLGLDKLEKNTTITMMWTKNNSLEVLVRADDSNVIYAKEKPDERFQSSALGRALFDLYLGEKAIIPELISRVAEGCKQLIARDEEKRGTKKDGSG